jgi:hypothetical protein
MIPGRWLAFARLQRGWYSPMAEAAGPGFEERWAAMSLAERFGNIGSEVGRAVRAKSGPHRERFQPALDRALTLFDLPTPDLRPAGILELRRAREVVCDYLVGENAYGTTAESLNAYFDAFARKARRGR